MNNPFPYSDSNKRYHTQNYALRQHFGGKVFKVSLNAGFTCPNIDGSRGFGGCSYCSDLGSGDFAGNPQDSFADQFDKVRAQMHKKWKEAQYISYFQAHTNTYAPIDTLKRCYDTAISFDGVVGLSIATRADCITEEIADLLASYRDKTYLTVELGLQSTFDATGLHINRCHSYQEFLDGLSLLQARGIRVCVHLINGLPHETHDMMVQNARLVGALGVDEIKLHLLHILRGTAIAREYEQGDFSLLSLEEYVQIICDQLEVIPSTTVIQRLTGDGAPDELLGPMWSLKKFVVLNEIDKELVRRDSYQGKSL